jgi:LysM repeat protein
VDGIGARGARGGHLAARFVLPLAALLVSACGKPATEATATPSLAALPATEAPFGASFVTATRPADGPRAAEAAPAPSTTPTPTATPVLYAIQPGDTLFDLAIRMGISLEQLLALNPGLQPELLSIGQSIVLPPQPTPAGQPAAIAPAATGQLTIQGLNWAADYSGRSWVFGELVNQGPGAVRDVRVRVAFQADTGAELAVYEVWTAPDTILPGGKAVFGILANEDVSDAWHPLAAVVAADATAAEGVHFDLAAEEVRVTIGGGLVTYEGRVRNRSDRPANQIVIVAVFYDDRARILGYRQQLLSATLEPGSTASFEAQASLPAGEVADHAVIVQGRVTQ